MYIQGPSHIYIHRVSDKMWVPSYQNTRHHIAEGRKMLSSYICVLNQFSFKKPVESCEWEQLFWNVYRNYFQNILKHKPD